MPKNLQAQNEFYYRFKKVIAKQSENNVMQPWQWKAKPTQVINTWEYGNKKSLKMSNQSSIMLMHILNLQITFDVFSSFTAKVSLTVRGHRTV